MAYIGRQNLGGAYRQLDDISSGFDGSDTTHTMQVNSANVTVGDVNQIILSLGGVIQKPGTDFTVSGSVLTFTTAPAANTSFFAVLLGSDNGGTVTPTDGSVTGDKIASNAAITTTGAANFNGGITMGGTTPTLTIGDAGAEDTKIVFDGNAQDFHIGLDDSADDLVIGVGSALGTTSAISITDGRAVTVGEAGVASNIAGITFYVNGDDDSSSMYTHDVSGTDNLARGNTSYGIGALDAVTTGDNITAIGNGALSASNTGVENTAIGKAAMNVSTTASYNVAVGNNAGAAMTEGNLYDVFVGHSAGTAVTTGDYNTFVGATAGTAVTTGAQNTLIGRYAGGNFDTESNNTAVGQNALAGPVAGGEYNVAIGNLTGDAITSGDQNTLVGYNVGSGLTTGGHNTLIGTALSMADVTHSNAIIIGSSFSGNGDRFSFGKASNVVQNTFTSDANWSRTSDERLKTNITSIDYNGLNFINELRPVTFNWKASQDVPTDMEQYKANENLMDTDVTIDFLIAQEVKAAMDKHSINNFSGWKEENDKGKTQLLSKEAFVVPLIKAVQELSAKVKALEDA